MFRILSREFNDFLYLSYMCSQGEEAGDGIYITWGFLFIKSRQKSYLARIDPYNYGCFYTPTLLMLKEQRIPLLLQLTNQ
jgi:hypothetical protein